MSTVEPRLSSGGWARGFTAIELAVTTVILASATLVIERTVSGVREAERTMKAFRNVASRGQEGAYRLRDLVAGSRKLFGNDANGNGYWTLLNRTLRPPLVGSRLPTFDEVNPLGPDDSGSPKTGNVLLFVREADPLPCVAVASTKKMRSVDTHRIVCAYLTQSSRTLVAGGQPSLDLVEWRGEIYPSYAQVKAISVSAEKTSVVKDLYNRYSCDYLWDPTMPPTQAFYAIDGNGNVAASPTTPSTIPEDRNFSKGGRFLSGNIAVAWTDLTSRPRTPVFTTEPVATWTPNGFEVKVVGASGARKVWIRLTIEQQASAGCVPAQQMTLVANARDL